MTQVTSAQANKILQAALFTAANRSHSLVNMLTEEAPKGAKVNGGKQTSAGAPVVRITDLAKVAGDTVDMQLFHQLSAALPWVTRSWMGASSPCPSLTSVLRSIRPVTALMLAAK